VKTSQTASQPRIAALDVVRGVAVLGILAANIVAFGQPMTAYTWPGGFLTAPGPGSDWLWGAQLVLVDGKFRGIFTLLFGAGMVLFYRRALERGGGKALLARRLAWLGLFGFLHWLLLWRGDILLSYAVAGLAVLHFVGWDWVRQLTLGLIGYAIGSIADFASSVPVAASAQGSFPAGSAMANVREALLAAQASDIADGKAEAALMASGDHGGLVRHTLAEHFAALPGDTIYALFEAAPLMLIGMALINMGIFEGTIDKFRQRLWGWALWLAGTLAAVPVAAWAIGRGITYWDSFAAFNGWLALPQLAAALGLALLLSLWGQHATGALARRLAEAGQCAFTNYIGTSALALAVFSGWGLGLFGQLGRLELYGVMLAFWAIMLAWPAWWLARFRHGPLEWLWRCLTYGERVPLRR
jgi:uncharacterized protein